ncbi:5-amino-6-(5-phospho-D-ribitylamino)uracil phosphatase YigB [Vibrio sonorensis]|uniref:5-amino-6-(5-phospho-D-ribitylamino)uracil phosphatase YigB n=1 Tax=Vibrio sonorensis TaxID=1004316 RepID=UPI0008DA32D7|nr:5-amino-6-(5-phospho-D-ribitylamino)uracil phosphatase YigB [Vibrio sonorensis]
MKYYRAIGPIRAMTFDLDDTLYDNWPVILRLEKELQSWFAKHHPIYFQKDHTWWQSLKKQVAIDNQSLIHNLSAWRQKYLEEGFRQLGYSDAKAVRVAEEAMVEVLKWRNRVDVPDSTHKVMRALANKYPLVAITNGNVDVKKIGLETYFSCVLKAGPDGPAKPLPDLFTKAAQHLGLPAKQILHVGDHLISDVKGAVDRGYQACWINDHQKCLRQERATLVPHIEITELSQLLLL